MALLFPTLQFLDPAYTQYARPLALGKIYLYESGTTTPKVAYTDSTEGTSLGSVITLNSNGQPTDSGGNPVGIWLSSNGFYKIVIKNAVGTTLQTLDTVTGLGSTLSSFSSLNVDLNTNGHKIVTSAGNTNIEIQPNGTGQTVIHGLQLADSLDANGFNIEMDTATAIADDSGNEYIKFVKTATAVNEISVTNQATGSNPQISATGGDTNIGLDFLVKGTGVYNFKSTASGPAELHFYEDTDNGSNYCGFKAPASLTNNNAIYTLPDSLPSVNNSILVYTTAGVPSPALPGMVYLGQLNQANSWASTTLLTNYKSFYLKTILNNSDFRASANYTHLGIQLGNGSYVTSGYLTTYHGVNVSSGAAIAAKSAVTSCIILADTTSGGQAPVVYQFNAFLNCDPTTLNSGQFSGNITNSQLASVGSNLTLIANLPTITTPSRIKLITGAGSVQGGAGGTGNPVVLVYGIVEP